MNTAVCSSTLPVPTPIWLRDSSVRRVTLLTLTRTPVLFVKNLLNIQQRGFSCHRSVYTTTVESKMRNTDNRNNQINHPPPKRSTMDVPVRIACSIVKSKQIETERQVYIKYNLLS
eukprot:09276_1